MAPKSTASDYPDRDPDLFYALARDRLSAQLETIDAVDNKIGLLVSLASALMGILAAVVALRGHSFGWLEIALMGLSALTYLFVALKAFEAYRARRWKTGPNLVQVRKALLGHDTDRLVGWQIANTLKEAYEINADPLSVKARVLPLLLGGVVTQTLLLGLLALALALALGEVWAAAAVAAGAAVALLYRIAASLWSRQGPA